MAVEIITEQDLDAFEASLLEKIAVLLSVQPAPPKPLLKSAEVRKLLGISIGTLQHLRRNKSLG